MLPYAFRRRLRRSLLVPSLAIGIASIVAALAATAFLETRGTLAARARRLSSMGEVEAADRLYRKSLEVEGVRIETLVGFIDNRRILREVARLANPFPSGGRAHRDDDDIQPFLRRDGVDRSVALLSSYWYAVQLGGEEADANAVLALADATPPARWANHLLARAAMKEGDDTEAARRFEREGLSFPREAAIDLRRALSIWSNAEEWDRLRERMNDPRFDAVIGASLRLDLALHDEEWLSVLRWLWPAGFDGVTGWPLLLAAVAAILWFSIAARMGRIGEGDRGRRLLYVSAFVLGVLSIYPTLLFIVFEEDVLGVTMTGAAIPDAIYFVFGVGLREELAKLLLFLPLLPFLNRRGSRIEALTCGALVGLGFAAEENVGYFRMLDVSSALGRFLTANFLHMALTALVAVAAYDASQHRRRPTGSLNSAFVFAIVVHGAYDFFLASPAAGELSFVAMVLFVLISQRFLRELLFAAPNEQRDSLVRLFVISLAILTGLSYVYATTLVGPLSALGLILTGALGVAILIYMFVRELGTA